jgi:hypothetical protein
MSDLLSIRVRKASFLEDLKDLRDEAKTQAPVEIAATTNIQRVYRGKVDRAYIAFKSNKAREIQRCFRGHCGRLEFDKRVLAKREKRVYALFKYFSMQIQRCFRGYYSRKYKSNHSDRKRFIGDLEETGRKVREMMYNYSMDQAIREEREAKEKEDRDFDFYASNLHHLMSTHQVPGVFNPPREYMITPTWRDQPVEEHVRNTIKDLLRTKGISKTGLVLDMNGTRKVPLRGLKSRLSVQASAPYESVRIEKQSKQLLHSILTREKGPWVAGGRTNIINPVIQPLSNGDPYVDSNMNPLLKKGVPESEKQLAESAKSQKALFDPPLKRAFYPRAGGNKSSAHPNDLFDIIGDAEESGGVLNRAMGTTSRFGLPESCDNRPPGGSAPAPPLRASTIRSNRPRINKFTIKAKAMQGGVDGISASRPSSKPDKFGLSGVASYLKVTGDEGGVEGEVAADYASSSDDE